MHRHLLTRVSISTCFLGILLLGTTAFAADDPIDLTPAIGPEATFHFQPEGTVFGDPIPFYHDGVHHVFYLGRYQKPDGKLGGLQWSHLASRNLVTWKQLPAAIMPDEIESFIATGSIIEKDGLFYAFYCTAMGKEKDRVICVATSRDLVAWTKSPRNPLIRLYSDVPKDVYDTTLVWRDPHVFWNPEANEWWMAVAAKEQTDGDYGPAGAVAHATSSDLMNWTVQREPMLLDRDSNAGECPDIFPFGNGWAMILYAHTSGIRLAASPRGPWRRPKNDAPSGIHFNAGKTEFDGRRTIWHAYLGQLKSDYDRHGYGGVMALPRELYLDESGNPAVRLVPEIITACGKDATNGLGPNAFSPLLKSPVRADVDSLILEPGVGDHALALWKNAPKDFFLSTDITMAEGSQLTFYLRSNAKVDDSYILRIDSVNSEVSFHHWTGWNRMSPMSARATEIPKKRSFTLHIMLHGDVFEAFIDDRIAIGSRVQIPQGSLAISARDGHVELRRFRITHLPGDAKRDNK
jgi:beta-fructofuranosidase